MGKFVNYISLILFIYFTSVTSVIAQSQFAKKFYGSGAPGSILQSRYGDIYVRTSDSSFYICTNVASFCNGVGAGQWQLSAGGGGGGGGTVTSVALSLPSFISVSGSPITGSGTLTGTLASQSANLFFASPDGTSGTPTFRSLVLGDISANLITNAKLATMPANTVKCNNTGATATAIDCTVAQIKTLLAYQSSDLSDASTLVKNNQANTYSAALQNFASAILRMPNSASLPATCSTGESYMLTSATSGQRWYLCESTNTWVVQGDGGGGGGGMGDPGSNGLMVRTALNTSIARTLTAGSTKISVSNGTGVAGNPTVDLGTVATTDLSDNSTIVKNNQANTYTGGALQDFSAMKVKPGATTIASLPSAGSNSNVVYLVTDASSLTDCSGGGGSTRTWCVSNGTSWVATTASSTGLGDPGSNSVVYRNGSGTTAPATANNISSPLYCESTTTNDSYACNLSPAIAAYQNGAIYRVKVDTDNTNNATLALNGLAATNITYGSQNLRTGMIKAGSVIEVAYNGTVFNLVSVRADDMALAEYTVSGLSGVVIPNSQTKVMVTDGITSTDCLSGGGTFRVVCEYTGSAWKGFGTEDNTTNPHDFSQSYLVVELGGSATQYLLVQKGTSAYSVTLAATSSQNVVGVALQTKTSGQNVGVQYSGTVRCIADNAGTAWNLVGVGTSTAGRCRDLGTSDPMQVSSNVQIIGMWVTAPAGAGSTGSVRLFNKKMMGQKPIQYITHSFDGGGATLTAATTVGKYVDQACTINQVVMEGDQSGTVAVTISRAAYGTTPSYSSISSGAGITAAVASKDTTLSGWTTSVAADSLIRAAITGTPTSMQKLVITIRCI